jgi:nicotinamide riboside kinase
VTLKIAITGPESTGKSTLAQQLADAYQRPYLNEYAREYMETLDRPYSYEDVIAIAKEQQKREDDLANQGHSHVFLDTDLLVLKIWLQDKFQSLPEWITEAVSPQRYDLFLLMYPDLAWQPDAQREDPERLNELFVIYENALQDAHLTYRVIRDEGEARVQNAMQAIEAFSKI